MKQIISWEYNIDTNCIEIKYTNDSMLCTYTIGVENDSYMTMKMSTDIGWLICNAPITYATES